MTIILPQILSPKETLLSKISIAPMMDCTDRHFRYLARLLSKNILLYTEMVTTGAILFGDRDRFLGYDSVEHPVALQLGGSNPFELAQAAEIGADYGYDEINLNVGCPSSRVQAGRFGACLMAESSLVADCVAAMQARVAIPITVKTRLGIDQLDSYDFLCKFIIKIAEAGCKTFIVHARKAWLKGLNPRENRTIPPLDYSRVYQLKSDFPSLNIVINGGIQSWPEIQTHLAHVDGVMIGRAAYQDCLWLQDLEQAAWGNSLSPVLSRLEILRSYSQYAFEQIKQGAYFRHVIRPLLSLLHGQPHARTLRHELCSMTPSTEKLLMWFEQFSV